MNNKSIETDKNKPESYLLIKNQDDLLTRHMKVKNSNELHDIISLLKINNRKCHFHLEIQSTILIMTIPLLLYVIFNFISFTISFHNDWDRVEKYTVEKILYFEKKIKSHTENDESIDQLSIRIDELKKNVNNDMRMDFQEYIQYRYNNYSHSTEIYVTDILITTCSFLTTILFFYISFILKRKAPLILTREKQLFITWIKGRAYVARYSQIGVFETKINVSLILYSLDRQHKIIKKLFPLHTSRTILFSSEKKRKDILAFITKYMVWGQSAVASIDYERDTPFYLRRDKKPNDFEQQVIDVLAALDKLDSPCELNTLTDKKGV